MTVPLDPVGVSAAAKAPCPVCGKSIHALDGAMSSGGEPMRHMDCERAASIDYAAAFDILYRRALDNQRTVNALVEVTTQEDGEPWEHDGLLMQLYSDDSTSWSTYESCVLAVAGSPADACSRCRGDGMLPGENGNVRCEACQGTGRSGAAASPADEPATPGEHLQWGKGWKVGFEEGKRRAASPADERLREALAFYADESTWKRGQTTGPFSHGDPMPAHVDLGERARAALAGVSAEATGVWPDQSAQHAVLLEQIKDAYAEGKADAVALIRERAALALPDLARFTLDEVEAIVGLSAEAAPDGILDELRRPNDEPHVAPSSNPYPFHEPLRVEHHSDEDKRQAWDEGYAAGVVAGRSIPSTGTGWDRGYAAGLAARDTQDGER